MVEAPSSRIAAESLSSNPTEGEMGSVGEGLVNCPCVGVRRNHARWRYKTEMTQKDGNVDNEKCDRLRWEISSIDWK